MSSAPQLQLRFAQPRQLEGLLREQIHHAKAGDAFAPVTVLVGSVLERAQLRRKLAAGGSAAVELLTPAELVSSLGSAALLRRGSVPLPSQLNSELLRLAVDRLLSAQQLQYFGEVARSEGFVSVLTRTLRELRQSGATPDQLEQVAAEIEASGDESSATTARKLRELAAIERCWLQLLESGTGAHSWFTVDQCYAHADLSKPPAPILASGLIDPPLELARLLLQISTVSPVSVLLPAGAEVAAGPGLRFLLSEGQAGESVAPELPAAHVSSVSAPDPEREVRDVVRACLRWAADGVPFRRIAIGVRDTARYTPLLREVFAEAGIPLYVQAPQQLITLPAGRIGSQVLELLQQHRTGAVERRSVVDLIAAVDGKGQLWERHSQVSLVGADRVSRLTGVAQGGAKLRDQLARIASEEGEASRDLTPELRTDAAALLALLKELEALLAAASPDGKKAVRERSDLLIELFEQLLPEPAPLVDVVRSLTPLAAAVGDCTPERYERLVSRTLEQVIAPDGEPERFEQRAVSAVDVDTLRFLDFECVAVVGLAERAYPPPPRQDALLLDGERVICATNGLQLPLRAGDGDPEPRNFALVTAAAKRELQLSFARTDGSGTRENQPSPLLQAASSETQLQREPAARIGPAQPTEAVSLRELQLWALREHRVAATAVLTAADSPFFGAAVAGGEARRERELTPWDGLLTEHTARELAASARATHAVGELETYATCPYRFMLSRRLRIRELREPEQRVATEPISRGSLIHAVLEQFFAEHGSKLSQGEAAAGQLRTAMLACAHAEFERAEEHGLPGYRLVWLCERTDLERLLLALLDRELADPPPASTVFMLEAELQTEIGGVELRGRADRIQASGSVQKQLLITDYKTSAKPPGVGSGEFVGGKFLQLPVYLYAASEGSGSQLSGGSAEYVYLRGAAPLKAIEFPGEVLADRAEELQQLVAELASGIRAGVFPKVPGIESQGTYLHCRGCEFNSICEVQRGRITERKQYDKQLQRVLQRQEQYR